MCTYVYVCVCVTTSHTVAHAHAQPFFWNMVRAWDTGLCASCRDLCLPKPTLSSRPPCSALALTAASCLLICHGVCSLPAFSCPPQGRQGLSGSQPDRKLPHLQIELHLAWLGHAVCPFYHPDGLYLSEDHWRVPFSLSLGRGICGAAAMSPCSLAAESHSGS